MQTLDGRERVDGRVEATLQRSDDDDDDGRPSAHRVSTRMEKRTGKTDNEDPKQNQKRQRERSDGHRECSSGIQSIPCSGELSDEFSFGGVLEVPKKEVGEDGEVGEEA